MRVLKYISIKGYLKFKIIVDIPFQGYIQCATINNINIKLY